MENLPFYISLLFAATTIAAVFIFYRATHNSRIVLFLMLAWMAVIGFISATGFFKDYDALPPRFAYVILPPLVTIIVLFNTAAGKKFIDKLNIRALTFIHIIRVPVELVLYVLFIYNAVPQLMTFEGRNFDILTGITAPLIYYVVFVKKAVGNQLLLAWNFIGLALVCFIVINGILSSPTPFQLFGSDQPNIAISHFPFIWLAAIVVPLSYFSHVASIRQLMKKEVTNQKTYVFRDQ